MLRATSHNGEYESTAFGFRPNPRYARISHIRKTLCEIAAVDLKTKGACNV